MKRINEIFYSLQGEGANAGTPAVFVRFAGCNLRCSFCDTDFSSFTEMSDNDICDAVSSLFPPIAPRSLARLVVLTGGEPSLQLDAALVDALHALNCFVAVETNGTHALPSGVDWVTCSPKIGAPVVLTNVSELKVVFTGVGDAWHFEEWRGQIAAEHYWLQPCAAADGSTNAAETVEYILSHPEWRLSVQVHKLLHFQ